MKIIICGSISASEEMLRVKLQLEQMGHEVEIPEGVKNESLRSGPDANPSDRAKVKIDNDLIREYFEKMKSYEAVLIVNPDKNGVKGYIGGNTLLEMGFAHVLHRKLYCLYGIPDMQYTSEILAMQPVALNGDLSKIS